MTSMPPLVIAALSFLAIFCVAACAARWYGNRKRRAASESREMKNKRELADLMRRMNSKIAKENATPNDDPHMLKTLEDAQLDRRLGASLLVSSPSAKRAVRSHAESRRRDAILYKGRQGEARSIRESPAAIRNRQQVESTDDDLMGALIVSSMITGTMDTCSEIPSTDATTNMDE